ncbi:MAG: addiction module protein [Gemmatimonadales bacterium]
MSGKQRMSIKELEAEALKLAPRARAKLAGKLLESLEGLSEKESQQLWAEEAQRRDAELDAASNRARSAEDVFREVRSKLE